MVDQRGFPIHALVNDYGPHVLHPSSVYPSLDIPPSSVHFVFCPTKARSACTVQRNTYGRRCSPEDMLSTPMRVLSMQRGQSSRKRLSPPFGHPEVNCRAMEGVDQRLDSFEGCSGGRGSWLYPGGGFCLVRPVKSVPWSLLVNRFTVLNVKEVNTDICEPIDAPLPSALDRKALPRRPKWEKRLPR